MKHSRYHRMLIQKGQPRYCMNCRLRFKRLVDIRETIYMISRIFRPDNSMAPLQFFKCLADDTRLRCLLLLESQGELCVCELMAALAESQPKVSRHLAQLRDCGLLIGERQGQWVFYRLSPDLPEWCRTVLTASRQANEDWIEADTARLNAMGDRPERVSRCC